MAWKSRNEPKWRDKIRLGARLPERQPGKIRHAAERTIPMTSPKAPAQKQPLCYCNFHSLGQLFLVTGKFGIEVVRVPGCYRGHPGSWGSSKENQHVAAGLGGMAGQMDSL